MTTPVAAAPATTAEILTAHDRLARYIHGHFRRRLTFEEARDAAAEAFLEADRAVGGGQRIDDLERWLRRAAWRNALDAIRKLEGEAQTPRERPVDLADHIERLPSTPETDALLDSAQRDSDTRALARAWSKLAADEQRALRLRYFDELGVEDILAILGCSRHHYENLTKRALRKLRSALVADSGDAACRACRALVLRGRERQLGPQLATQRDTHLETCLACRAFDRRERRLLAAAPLPALGLLDRLWGRAATHLSGPADPAQAEQLAGGIALAGGGAASVGAATSGALGVAGAAKAIAVVCSAGAVTAGVCGGIALDRRDPGDDRPRVSAEQRQPQRPASDDSTPLTRAARPTPAGTSAPPKRAGGPAEREPRGDSSPDGSSPFLPESSAEPVPPRRHSGADPASAAPRQTGPEPAPRSPPQPSRATPSGGDAFTEEFAP